MEQFFSRFLLEKIRFIFKIISYNFFKKILQKSRRDVSSVLVVVIMNHDQNVHNTSPLMLKG